MKLKTISLNNIRGFKYLPKTELSPRINLFIGPNNSGKSTILNSIFLIQNQKALSKKDVTIGTKKNGTIIFEIEGTHPPIPDSVDKLILDISKDQLQIRSNNSASNTQINPIPDYEPHNLIYPFLSKRKVDDYTETVKEEYENSVTGTFKHLSLKIDRLAGFPPNDEYIEACKKILGFVVSSQTIENGKRAVYKLNSDKSIPLTSMGDGIPNILGLIVDLCRAKNKIFLIEELENDIHPKALKELLKLIIRKSENNQFFISTHSNIVMKYLGGVETSRLFHITNEKRRETIPELFISELSEISDEPSSRRLILEELGYDFFDFDLWKGWLFLEESSAEIIIRDNLIRWFVPELRNKLRTFSAGSISQVESKFEDFNKLFVFLHLEPTYKNKVWVILDAGDSEKEIVEKLKSKYSKSGWDENNFNQFNEHDFEKYYPKKFEADITKIFSLPSTNKQEKREEKRKLLHSVLDWITKNDKEAKEEFKGSAKEIINTLKEINKKLE